MGHGLDSFSVHGLAIKAVFIDFQNDALAASFSVEVLIGDLIWSEDAADVPQTPIVEGPEFIHDLMTCQHSDPYSRTDFTLLLYSRCLVLRLYWFDFQMG